MFFSFPSLLFSDFLPSSLHSRPASFLSWCVSVTLESKTWVLSKECVFLCPIWAPLHPSLLESHILLQLSFPRTYHCFPTVGSLLAPLSITVLSQLFLFVFSPTVPESYICNYWFENFGLSRFRSVHASADLWHVFHDLYFLNLYAAICHITIK